MCSVCVVGIFISKGLFFGCFFFLILTVTVYLDTIGCVIAKMLSVYLSEWNKRLLLFDRCYRFTS